MTLATNVTQAVISLRSYLNPQGPTQQSFLNYSSPDGFTAGAGATHLISIPASTSNYQLNLPSLFAAFLLPLFVYVADATNPGLGFAWGFTSGGTRQVVGAGLWLAWMADGATALQPLYIDNTSINILNLSVGVMSN